jgi:hypothetical protein
VVVISHFLVAPGRTFSILNLSQDGISSDLQATDAAGNTSQTQTVTVTVPKS